LKTLRWILALNGFTAHSYQATVVGLEEAMANVVNTSCDPMYILAHSVKMGT
jgi:hypothetical protein